MQKTLPFLMILLVLGGCSSFRFPGVYRLDVQQGNLVTQDKLDQLQPGMTRAQVRYILGTPLLVDTFHQDRWEYLYSMQKGGQERSQERLTVYFDNDRLAGFSGNFHPSPPAAPATTPAPAAPAATTPAP